MATMQAPDGGTSESSEVEFFGVKLKVRNAHLAALLNSDVHEDVQVIGRRARSALGAGNETHAERGAERGVQDADGSVEIRLDEAAED
jgi:hypothetical protein